jgi:hypothetical protein
MNDYDETGMLKGDHPVTICSEYGCNEPVREQIDPDYCPKHCDDALYCQFCGAKRKQDCDCGPIANNN